MIDMNVLKGVSPDYLLKHKFIPFSRSDEGVVTVVVHELNNDGLRRAVDELFQGNVSSRSARTTPSSRRSRATAATASSVKSRRKARCSPPAPKTRWCSW